MRSRRERRGRGDARLLHRLHEGVTAGADPGYRLARDVLFAARFLLTLRFAGRVFLAPRFRGARFFSWAFVARSPLAARLGFLGAAFASRSFFAASPISSAGGAPSSPGPLQLLHDLGDAGHAAPHEALADLAMALLPVELHLPARGTEQVEDVLDDIARGDAT